MVGIEDRGGRSTTRSHGRHASGRAAAWVRAGLVVVVVIAADQLSKRAIEDSIVRGEERKLLPGIQLVNTRNRGVAFGFLPGSHVGVTVLIGVALLVLLLLYFARHCAQPLHVAADRNAPRRRARQHHRPRQRRVR